MDFACVPAPQWLSILVHNILVATMGRAAGLQDTRWQDLRSWTWPQSTWTSLWWIHCEYDVPGSVKSRTPVICGTTWPWAVSERLHLQILHYRTRCRALALEHHSNLVEMSRWEVATARGESGWKSVPLSSRSHPWPLISCRLGLWPCQDIASVLQCLFSSMSMACLQLKPCLTNVGRYWEVGSSVSPLAHA